MNWLDRRIARRILGRGRSFSTHHPNQREEQQKKSAHQQKQEEEQKGRGQAEAVDEGNITRQNFWRSLESFKARLGAADFVGFDLEPSGIRSTAPFEPPQEAPPSPLLRSYRRIKHLAEKFTVFQVGFALFHRDPACNRFLAYPYNFYVFPRNELSLGLCAAAFSCEASALDFLAAHGFDFDLCIHDGISYLSKAQESEARAHLANKRVQFRLKSCGCIRSLNNTSDVVFAERLRVDLEKWHSKISTCNLNLDSHVSELVADIFSFKLAYGCPIKDFKVPYSGALSKCPSLALQLENHHQVCLAQLVLDKHFKDLVYVVRSDCDSGASHNVEIFFTKSEECFAIAKNELEQGCEQAKINEAISFRHIIDVIVSLRKPLIGHNCALDLAHMHDKFLLPLPSLAEEFSTSLLAHFPTIIDTKYLMKFVPGLQSSWKKKQTSLYAVYTNLCKSKNISQQSSKAQIDIMAGFKRYQDRDGNHLHEAGYDAFMTGCVFAQICHQLSIDIGGLLSTVHDTPRPSGIAEFANLLSFGPGILDLRTGKLRAPAARFKDIYQIPVMKAIYCVEG